MRLLIWQSYGTIEVYTAEEHGFFERLKQALRDLFVDWHDEETVAAIDEAEDLPELVDIVRPHVNTHESIEQFHLTQFKNYTLREVRK